jgi:hypothetical protein
MVWRFVQQEFSLMAFVHFDGPARRDLSWVLTWTAFEDLASSRIEVYELRIFPYLILLGH